MTTNPARQPKGRPTGGQFAAKSNPESNVQLPSDAIQLITVGFGTNRSSPELLKDAEQESAVADTVGITSDALDVLMADSQITDTDPAAMEAFSGDTDARTLVTFIGECDTHGVFTRTDGFPYSVTACDVGEDVVLIGITPTYSDDPIWTGARVTTVPHEVAYFQHQAPTGRHDEWTSPSRVAELVAKAIQAAMPLVDRLERAT